jgi:hypothetical protein
MTVDTLLVQFIPHASGGAPPDDDDEDDAEDEKKKKKKKKNKKKKEEEDHLPYFSHNDEEQPPSEENLVVVLGQSCLDEHHYINRKMTSCLDGLTMRHLDFSTFIVVLVVEVSKFVIYVAVFVSSATACVRPDHGAAIKASPLISLYFSFDIGNKFYRWFLWVYLAKDDFVNPIQVGSTLLVMANSIVMMAATIAYSRTLKDTVNFAANSAALIAVANVDVAMFPNMERLRLLPKVDVFMEVTSQGGWKYQSFLFLVAFLIIVGCFLWFNLSFYPTACMVACPCYSKQVCEYLTENGCDILIHTREEMCSWNTTVLSCHLGDSGRR